MIEGTDLFEYFMCPYKVYNRHNRDRKLMIAPSEFAKRIMELGRNHEKEVVSHITYMKPSYPRFDFSKGFIETHKIMKLGADNIYQAILKDDEYLGIPDLIIKQEGESNLGNYHYIAADVKSSIRSKEQQIMQLMLYDYILEKIQGFSARKGMLILKNVSEMIDLSKYEEKFKVALAKVHELDKGKEFGMHIDTVCRECSWRNVCIPLAKEKNDVSLIYGLSRPVHFKLLEQGIKTVKDLEEADPKKLTKIEGIADATVIKWKRQAKVLLENKDNITKLEFPETKNHICFDLEISEDKDLYLIGLWQDGKFKHFFSEDNEEKVVEDFVEYLLSLDNYKLYHYGTIERTLMRTLFKKYGVEENIAQGILDNMIDLLPIIKKHAVLPLTYYNLKDVAKHFGFKWDAEDASGGNSMTWFKEWTETKDKDLYKKILRYNEDDVHGTYIVLKKLGSNIE